MLNCRSQFRLVGGELHRRSVLCRSVHLVCRLARVRLAMGHLPPIGLDIEAEYPAARPSAFRPSLADVDVRWPGSTAGPSLLEPATSAFAGVPSAAQVTLMLRRCVHVCARIPRCRQAM